MRRCSLSRAKESRRAEKLLGRSLKISDDLILRHYHNRGILPFEIAQNLSDAEDERRSEGQSAGGHDRCEPIYLRIYPNGSMAGQIIGYTGKTGATPDGIIDNHEVLWPETEGREGLEQTFNDMLTGQHGEYKMTFDKDGRKTSERIVEPPVPGYNVVTTLDLHLQELAEKALEAKAKRGAIVIIDPNTGDILAMASWPTYRPERIHPVDFGREIQGAAGRSRHSASAARVSFRLSAGIDLQGRGRHRRAGERHDHARTTNFDCVPAIEVGNADLS